MDLRRLRISRGLFLQVIAKIAKALLIRPYTKNILFLDVENAISPSKLKCLKKKCVFSPVSNAILNIAGIHCIFSLKRKAYNLFMCTKWQNDNID